MLSFLAIFRLSFCGVAMLSRLLKIIGFFCERAYKKIYILQKRPIIEKSLPIVGTLYYSPPLKYYGMEIFDDYIVWSDLEGKSSVLCSSLTEKRRNVRSPSIVCD